MSDQILVQTVFESVDKSSGPLAKIAKAGKETEKSLERAKKQAEQLAKTPVGIAAKHSNESETHAKKRGGWMDKLDEAERERFIEEKQELQLRKARVRGQKLEQGKEHAVHRAADVALMLTGSEENKFAKALSKTGGAAQVVGNSMVGLGGGMGKVGGVMASLGGYAALAGVAFEGLAYVDEMTGGHIEHAGEAVTNWAQHLVGMTNTTYDMEKAEEKAAKALGYRNKADYKAAEAAEQTWFTDRNLANSMQANLRRMKAMPADRNSAEAVEAHEEMVKAAADTASRMNTDLAPTIKLYEEAMQHTMAGVLEHADREAELADMEKKTLSGLSALPLDANAEETKAFTSEVGSAVNKLMTLGLLYDDEAEAFTKNIMAKVAENDSMATLIERNHMLADQEAEVDNLVKQYAKTLRHMPGVHGKTIVAALKLNDAIAQFTEQLSTGSNAILKSPEMAKMFQQKLETKAHHFDFRGSKFDIKQQFADVDADRIAVAFSRDLAGLGERRVQSSFAPLFAT